MTKTILLLSFFLLSTFVLTAQQQRMKEMEKPGSIYGSVADDNQAMPFASVSLYRAKDSSLVSGIITDDRGKFEFQNLAYGNYYLKISFVGFKSKDVGPIEVSQTSTLIKIPDVTLEVSAENLNTVEVSSNLPSLEYKIDRKIVNVSKQLTATSGTAVDVLQNVPSVQVDITGEVSLRGSSGFMVFIDGRPSALSGSDALNQIPASTIDRIELITNPSAKYDPDGTSGIINVITKKNMLLGFSGVVNGNIGLDDKYGGDFLLYYRKKKINYFIGADYNHQYFPGIERINRFTTSSDTSYITRAEGAADRSRTNYTLRTGVELELGIKDKLNLSGSIGQRAHSHYSKLEYHESTDPFIAVNEYTSRNIHDRSGGNYQLNADYEHKFSKENHTFDAQINYNYRNTDEKNDNDLLATDGTVFSGQRSTEVGPGTELRGKLDYTLPLGIKSRIESGAQARFEVSSDTNKVYNYDQITKEYLFQSDFSNSVEYKRDIYALYAIYAGELDMFGYQAGIRTEYTDRTIKKLDGDSTSALNRWDYFPSVHVSYKLPKDHQLMVSYSRRIERPRGWYFEPFITWVDAYNVRRGNPDLLPEYVDSYELGYNKRINKTMYSLEAYYRVVHNKIERIRSVYKENIMLTSFDNVGTDYSLGLEGMISTDVYKWWNLDIMGNLYDFRGDYNTDNLNNESTNWNARFNNTFYLTPSTQFQVNSQFQSASVTAQGRVEEYYIVNAAFKQTFFKNSLSATLQASDIFQSQKRKYTSEGVDFRTEEYSRRYSPIVMLNVSYRINNFKVKTRKGSDSGGDGGDDF